MTMIRDSETDLYSPDDGRLARWGLTPEEVRAIYDSGKEGHEVPRLDERFRWMGPRNATVAAAIARRVDAWMQAQPAAAKPDTGSEGHPAPAAGGGQTGKHAKSPNLPAHKPEAAPSSTPAVSADDLRELDTMTAKAEAGCTPIASPGNDKKNETPLCLDIIPAVPDDIRSRLETVLDASRFDFDNPPPELPPVITLDAGEQAHVIACTGYLVAIQGGPKAGKSAVLQAIMAASMTPPSRRIDAFGFKAWNEAGKAVVHFDFEQSARDHDRLMRCALRRAGVDREPPWMRSYRLTKLDAQSRMFTFLSELDRAQREHGGIFAIILDGLADLIPDPNDPEKAFQLVDMLHALAEKLETVIIAVIHENPGTETGKTRGHLGSHLERKAETNLRLSKDSTVTTIFSEKSRSCNIPKEIGPRFAYEEGVGLHVSASTLRDAKSAAKREKLAELARAVFETSGKRLMAASALVRGIESQRGCKDRQAWNLYRAMLSDGIINETAGFLSLVS